MNKFLNSQSAKLAGVFFLGWYLGRSNISIEVKRTNRENK